MKVTNSEIYNTRDPLRRLMAIRMPVLVSLELVKFSKLLQPHLDTIEQVRDKLISENGEADEKRPGGSKISPEMEGFPKFAEEFGTLLEQEVEIDFEPVTIPPTIAIEPYVIMALEKFVVVGSVEVVPIQKITTGG